MRSRRPALPVSRCRSATMEKFWRRTVTRRLMVVLGTRPDAIKLAPVIVALRSRPQDFETIVCSTDQHREMLDQALTAFGVTPDMRLNVMRPDQTLPDLTARLISEL